MPKVSFRMASASRESVFGVQTNTARKIHRSDHTKGRQPGHDTTPAFTRERARRLPTPAPLRWTKRSYPLAGRSGCQTLAVPEWTKKNFDDLRDVSPEHVQIQWRV